MPATTRPDVRISNAVAAPCIGHHNAVFSYKQLLRGSTGSPSCSIGGVRVDVSRVVLARVALGGSWPLPSGFSTLEAASH